MRFGLSFGWGRRPLPKRSCSRSPEAGSLIIIVIWVLTVFAILSVGLARIVSAQLRLTKRIERRSVSQALVHAALQYARLERQHDDTDYDTLAELGRTHQRTLGIGAFLYTMVDEESRIHLNKASQQVIARLPEIGLDEAVAMTSSTLRPFPVKEVVSALEEITAEKFLAFRDLTTVYGTGRVNINTASAPVLAALDLDANLVNKILAYREGPDQEEGTADDGIFQTRSGILERLRIETGLPMSEAAALTNVLAQGLIDVHSTHVSLQVQTTVFSQEVSWYTIVMDTETGKVRQWRER